MTPLQTITPVRTILAAAISLSMAGAIAAPAPALAADRGIYTEAASHCDHLFDREERRRCRRNGGNSTDDDIGAAIGLGIVGITLGAILAGAAAEDQKKKDREYQRWLNYCAQKYRSFDPYTGTYIDRYGRERPCR